MKFIPTPLKDAYTVELERRGDDRGFFARLFCQNEFKQAGLVPSIVQMNNSLSAKKGTLRGLHYQLPPNAEMRLVRCIRGALWDAILICGPTRQHSANRSAPNSPKNNRLMMYVPPGFAHAILTLSDIFYLVSAFYAPDQERGVRWNDPKFQIAWPIEPTEVSPRDASWPDFDPEFHGTEQLRGI